ncbi:MAG TPA: DUF3106 domain-containing protein [Gallionella sp.]|nr:DUF3106 domain-containing protein [Gallionella sp.]
MNNKLKNLMIAAGIIASFSLNALAADATPAPSMPDHAQHLERMKTLTPEQRAKEQEEMQQKMQSLTPEQRAEHRKAMREQWEKMSPEDRKAMHDAMHEDMQGMSPDECKVRHEAMDKNGMTPQQFGHGNGQHCNVKPPKGPCPYDKTKPTK